MTTRARVGDELPRRRPPVSADRESAAVALRRASRIIWWTLGILAAATLLALAGLLIAFRGGSFPTG